MVQPSATIVKPFLDSDDHGFELLAMFLFNFFQLASGILEPIFHDRWILEYRARLTVPI